MGDREQGFGIDGDDDEPRPGSGVPGSPVLREARRQEALEHEDARLGIFDDGLISDSHADELRTQGAALARDVVSAADLRERVLKNLFGSHGIRHAADARIFIDAAAKEFSRGDRDWAHYLALAMYHDYERQGDARRAKRVSVIVDRIEDDLFLKLQLETGLSAEFIGAFLETYSAPLRRPMQIHPHSVPVFQLYAPTIGPGVHLAKLVVAAAPIAQAVKSFVPGIGLIEAVAGEDLISGERLTLFDRVLGAVTDLLPFIPGIARGASRVARGGGQAAEGVVRGLRGISTVADLGRSWATAAFRIGLPSIGTLRFIGRLSQAPRMVISALRRRLQKAIGAQESVTLTTREAGTVNELRASAAELNGAQSVAGNSRPLRGGLKVPRASRFAVSSAQEQVAGRILGKRLRGARPAVRTALKEADDTATGLLNRFADHWDAAVTGKGETKAQAAKRVFDELTTRRISKEAANKWTQGRLYGPWRDRVLRRVHGDATLRKQLADKAGIYVEREKGSDTASIFMRTVDTNGQTVKTKLNFHHEEVGHLQAVERALDTGDYRHLISTVDSSGLVLTTADENQAVIEGLLRHAQKFFGE